MHPRRVAREDDAEGVWKRASQSGDSFVTELIKGRRFKADQVAEFAAVSFGFPYLDLGAMDADSLPQGSAEVAPRLVVVPKLQLLPAVDVADGATIKAAGPSLPR